MLRLSRRAPSFLEGPSMILRCCLSSNNVHIPWIHRKPDSLWTGEHNPDRGENGGDPFVPVYAEMIKRSCFVCMKLKHKKAFSAAQWTGSKRYRCCRCKQCTSDHLDYPGVRRVTGLRSDYIDAEFWEQRLRHPRVGTTYNVARGHFMQDKAARDPCVIKWPVQEEGGSRDDVVPRSNPYDCYDLDIERIKFCLVLITEWNHKKFIEEHVKVNIPDPWIIHRGSIHQNNNNIVMVERYIEGAFRKFNSNTGWCDDRKDPWSECLQALCHYSYHITEGQHLMCNLQGTVDDTYGVHLSNPLLLSQTQEWGPTDLGKEGIESFMTNHKCGEFCQPNWRKLDYQPGKLHPQIQQATVRRSDHSPCVVTETSNDDDRLMQRRA